MSKQFIHRAILAFLLSSSGAIAQQYTISTLAGNGTAGFVDGDALGGAQLNSPTGVAVDSSGKVYIADSANHRIRMVSGGTVSTVAGNGTGAYAGDGASATAAQLNNPNAVAVDSSGNLYIADTQNHIIRKVSGGTISLVRRHSHHIRLRGRQRPRGGGGACVAIRGSGGCGGQRVHQRHQQQLESAGSIRRRGTSRRWSARRARPIR